MNREIVNEEFLAFGLWLCQDVAIRQRVFGALAPQMFSSPECRALYTRLKRTPDETPCPAELHQDLLESKAFANFHDLSVWMARGLHAYPNGALGGFVVRNARILVDDYRDREFVSIAEQGIQDVADQARRDGVVARTKAALESLEAVQLEVDDGQSLSSLAGDIIDSWDSGLVHDEGISTGSAELDQWTHRMKPGEMYVVGARPGVGKSAYALHVIRGALDDSKRCLLVTLEMTRREALSRLLVSESGVEADVARDRAKWRQGDAQKLTDAHAVLSKWPLDVIDAGAVTVGDVEAAAAKHQPQLVVVDYLQLLKPTSPSAVREQQVAECSRRLKQLAGVQSCPVLVLAQLNRQAVDTGPQLRHLRESGAIEQDANVVIMLDRAEGVENDLWCYVRKNRDGRCGSTMLHFDPATLRIGERAAQRYEEFDAYA